MKLANRHMIWTEALAASIAASICYSIAMGGGLLQKSFSGMPASFGHNYSTMLGVPALVISLFLLVVCVAEWKWGRGWDIKVLRWVSRIRFVLNVLLFLGMSAVLIGLIQTGLIRSVPSISVECLILIIAFGASAFKSKRLVVLLDPELKTEKLEKELPTSW